MEILDSGNADGDPRLTPVVLLPDPSTPGSLSGTSASGADERFRGRLVEAVPGLRRYASARFGADRATDVVQETLLTALESAKTFDHERSMGPWLHTIAERLAARKGERSRLEPNALDDPDAVAEEESRVAATEEVAELLGRLAPADAHVVRRHHLAGESVAEIATSLGEPEGTIKARLWRARKRLAVFAGVTGGVALLAFLRWSAPDPLPHAPMLLSSSFKIERIHSAAPKLRVIEPPVTAPGVWRVVSHSGVHTLESSARTPSRDQER